MNTRRPYDMSTRSAAADRTRTGILHAAIELAGETPLAALTLPLVAERAGVSVQTVLRAWGSREGLLAAARELAVAEVTAEREAPVGDVRAAIDVLLDHYERRGDLSLLMLAQEGWEPLAAEITTAGKQLHRDWVEGVFAPSLAPLEPAARTEAVDLLVVATDLYAWKLLRRDRGRSRTETAERMRRLVDAVAASLEATAEEPVPEGARP